MAKISKLARKPLAIPDGVEVVFQDNKLQFKGKQGNMEVAALPYLSVEVKEKQIIIAPLASHKQARANSGTLASLVKNAVRGVSEGFAKALEVEGVGFRASMEGNVLVLNIGFTHPVKFEPPAGIKIAVEKGVIKVSGNDKSLVGLAAAKIRAIRKPEPYKGKGIHYVGETIRRKAGKKVAGAAAS